mgnify:CR=1 FL=1
MEKSDWFADAVAYVTEKGLMNGTDDNQFSPSASTTRGMLMTVLARYAGEDTADGATWYEKGMNWAKANGVSDGTNPNANITREQLVTMLYRYAGSPAVNGSLSDFLRRCKRKQLRCKRDAVGRCERHRQRLQWQAEPAEQRNPRTGCRNPHALLRDEQVNLIQTKSTASAVLFLFLPILIYILYQ